MFKKLFLLSIVMMFGLSTTRVSAEDEPKLGVWADMTYVSKYIYRGVDFYGDNGAWQPSVYFDLFQTGFNFGIWASIPDEQGDEEWTELDINPSYCFNMFQGEDYQANVTLEYWYFGYPKSNHFNEDQSAQLKVKMPNLIKIGDIKVIPMYFYCQKWPVSSGLPYQVAGYFHQLRLTTIVPISEKQTLDFMAETVYRGNVWGLGNGISHVQLSLSSSFDMGNGFCLTPGINYQYSMMESVNTEDELWTSLSLSKSF